MDMSAKRTSFRFTEVITIPAGSLIFLQRNDLGTCRAPPGRAG